MRLGVAIMALIAVELGALAAAGTLPVRQLQAADSTASASWSGDMDEESWASPPATDDAYSASWEGVAPEQEPDDAAPEQPPDGAAPEQEPQLPPPHDGPDGPDGCPDCGPDGGHDGGHDGGDHHYSCVNSTDAIVIEDPDEAEAFATMDDACAAELEGCGMSSFTEQMLCEPRACMASVEACLEADSKACPTDCVVDETSSCVPAESNPGYELYGCYEETWAAMEAEMEALNICGEDEHVAAPSGDHVCTACAPGKTRAAGDDIREPVTECETVLCEEDHYRLAYACVPCPT